MKARQYILSGLIIAAAALLGCQVSPFGTLNSLQTGEVRVNINGANRTTQAVLADIHHLTVGVQTIDGLATKSILASALTNSNASASTSFGSLKPCTATVSVEAFSATGSIGLATASAVVAPLQITDVNLHLTLAPNYDLRGNIYMGIDIQDGPTVIQEPTPRPAL